MSRATNLMEQLEAVKSTVPVQEAGPAFAQEPKPPMVKKEVAPTDADPAVQKTVQQAGDQVDKEKQTAEQQELDKQYKAPIIQVAQGMARKLMSFMTSVKKCTFKKNYVLKDSFEGPNGPVETSAIMKCYARPKSPDNQPTGFHLLFISPDGVAMDLGVFKTMNDVSVMVRYLFGLYAKDSISLVKLFTKEEEALYATPEGEATREEPAPEDGTVEMNKQNVEQSMDKEVQQYSAEQPPMKKESFDVFTPKQHSTLLEKLFTGKVNHE